ncbi:zf-HC2 domain-containing protein [Yinghuangia soli]|uniref:Zf-HC2 domain-containing protein n=1 Tax=Yinghuangia soli TaxID=2908204 RepID=A0AA41U9P5_9ACTN|nr:zf-HC2 domain-containing protein [Yinghuangia soli]MCF2534044.1 zf-HC2 domain-containing protein [Yinghuangia soli]
MSTNHHDTGAYALHALPPDEHAALERHLARCETCATETAELVATAARLGLAVHTVPPPELKKRVLRAISTVRQEPATRATIRRSWWPAQHLASLAVLQCAAVFRVLAAWRSASANGPRTPAPRPTTPGSKWTSPLC